MRRIMNIVFPVIAVAAGIAVIVIGAVKLHGRNLYDASTTGVITGIEREWTGTDDDGFDQYDYTVYVDYEVDGKKYENAVYPAYDSSMKKGDEVEILYKSSDPASIAEGDLTGSAVFTIVIGAVLAVIGAVMTVKAIFKP